MTRRVSSASESASEPASSESASESSESSETLRDAPPGASSSSESSSTSSSSSKTSSCVENAVLRFLCFFAGAAARFALAPWDRSVNRRIRPRSSLVRGFATCFAVATAAASVATAGTAAVDMDGTATAGTETITVGGGAGGIATAAAVAFVASTVGTTTPGAWGAADAPADAAIPCRHGRRFSIARSDTALVCIDLQRDFVEATGRIGGRYADLKNVDAAVRKASELLKAARAAGLTIAHSRSHRYGATIRDDLIGDPGYELCDACRARDGEIVVDKWTFGAFASTDLEARLRQRGVRRILLCGVLTNVCVMATAVQALSLIHI